jgi:hypothetical protein
MWINYILILAGYLLAELVSRPLKSKSIISTGLLTGCFMGILEIILIQLFGVMPRRLDGQSISDSHGAAPSILTFTIFAVLFMISYTIEKWRDGRNKK